MNDKEIRLLKGIYESLQQLNQTTEKNNQLLLKLLNQPEEDYEKVSREEIITSEDETIISRISLKDINAELFKELVDVYLQEEILKRQTLKSKKSARRVSVKLYEKLEEFFYNQLQGVEGLSIERSKEGFIVFKRYDEAMASLKFTSDLGFYRAERWYDEVDKIVELSGKLFGTRNVFVLVSSLVNGVEKKHIESVLKQPISSVGDFLNNNDLTRLFVDRYLNGMRSIPKSNCFILSANKHPNIISDELLKTKEKEKELYALEKSTWLSDVNDLFKHLKSLLLF